MGAIGEKLMFQKNEAPENKSFFYCLMKNLTIGIYLDNYCQNLDGSQHIK